MMLVIERHRLFDEAPLASDVAAAYHDSGDQHRRDRPQYDEG